MSRTQGSIRIGPISLFSLVILLCLAVLSVLTVATTQSISASAHKHAALTTAGYENESAAQALVADIDSALVPFRMQNAALGDIRQAVAAVLPEQAHMQDSLVFAEFVTDSGRTLSITLAIDADATYRIITWQATTQWNLESGDVKLWSGNDQQQ